MTKEVYTLDDLRNWRSITADCNPPLRLAVIGDPVAHSLSPQMHNAALAALDIPARYTRLHLHTDELTEALGLLRKECFIGINCTIPHKAAVLANVTQADEGAKRAGGVNTVVVEPDGMLSGFSTDGPGFSRAVRESFGAELASLRVLIFGAGGGAGRAVAMQCAAENCQRLSLINRTVEKLADVVEELKTFYPADRITVAHSMDDHAGQATPDALAAELEQTDLIVNCSAVGMEPDDKSPIPPEFIRSSHLLYDTIYVGDQTPFLRAGEAVGARTANGLSMLLHQGALSFERWFNREAPLEVMRAALLAQ